MKNKKGFTLIELLAVIALLGIVIGIAVPSVIGVNNMIKKNMRDEKIEIIEEAATLYGTDFKSTLLSSGLTYNGYKCISLNVYNLVPNYLDRDVDGCEEGNCIIDPADDKKYLDNLEVIIYIKNKRIQAIVDVDNNLKCIENIS